MATQEVVKMGSKWQVGNGSSIQIWLDKWLPTHSTFRVISLAGTFPQDSRVCTLIDEETGEWKADMIRQHFLPADADAILGIPSSRNLTRNRLIWAYTPKGIFIVNSAYKVALSLSPHANPCTTSQGSDHTHFWRTIWALNIPHKIKTFTWKACRALLTKVNLCHRGILKEALCEACVLSEETSGHLFWDCTKARETWTMVALTIDIHTVHYREFVDFIWHLIFNQHVGKELLGLVVTIAWCMWYTRNKARPGTTR